MLLGRAKLRRGEREEAVSILESVHTPKPEAFANDDDQNAWFLACRLLGDLYLRQLDRPDLAVQCYTAYRNSAKSGADTLYKLGEAYEQLGEARRAAKFYEQVTAYDEHPLAPDARARVDAPCANNKCDAPTRVPEGERYRRRSPRGLGSGRHGLHFPLPPSESGPSGSVLTGINIGTSASRATHQVGQGFHPGT